MRLTTAGTGDAFGSGGRFQACIHVERSAGTSLLIDCGARRFAVEVVEVDPGSDTEIDGVRVEAFLADHAAGAPALSLRVRVEDRVIDYSGDTAWTPALLDVAAGADLFLCEGYTWAVH